MKVEYIDKSGSEDVLSGDFYTNIKVNIGNHENNCGSEHVSTNPPYRDMVVQLQEAGDVFMFAPLDYLNPASSDPNCPIVTLMHSELSKPDGIDFTGFVSKFQIIPINYVFTLPIGNPTLQRIQMVALSKGAIQTKPLTFTIAVCGSETISSVPLYRNYGLVEQPIAVSWEESRIIAESL